MSVMTKHASMYAGRQRRAYVLILRVVWNESGLPCTQAWLQRHGPFDAVLDGANIALFGQNVDRGAFSFAQIEAALGRLRADGSGMRPLLVRACSVG